MIPPYVGKMVLAATLPLLLQGLKEFFSGPVKPQDRIKELLGTSEPIEPKKEDPKPSLARKTKVRRPNQKPRDMRQINQAHYDYALEIYNKCTARNEASGTLLMTQKDIARKTNEVIKLNKSVTIYRKIWSGEMKREDLPPSDEVFPYED